jgi:uncharacterized protein with HEPN domain
MIEAISGIETAISGKSFEDYRADWSLRLATQRGIEIISEASRSLPETAKLLTADIRWQKISAIGNVLRHEYYSIADRISWGVLVDELPPLKEALKEIQRSLKS